MVAPSERPTFPPHELVNIIPFRTRKPYRDPAFLHQKYVVEGLSPKAIAELAFSSRQTIKKHLVEFGIPLRWQDKRRGAPLAFGHKWRRHKAVMDRREQDALQKMVELRRQGFSYPKIADVLNAMKVPTKKGKAKWFPNSVYQALHRARIEGSEKIAAR